MLKDEYVKMKWTKNNKKHYVEKGYLFTNFGDEFVIKVEDLPVGSHFKVNVICDYCGIEIIKEYRYHTNEDCCCKCKTEKSKKTNLARLGVEFPMQSKEVMEKSKKTTMEKYGVERPLQSKEIFGNLIKNNIEKYGVKYTIQLDKVKEKVKQTCLEKYNVEHPLQNEDILKKQQNTCFERYGTIHPMKLDEFKEKAKDTCLKKYGVENVLQLEEFREKIKQTVIKKYNVDSIFKVDVIREKIKKTMIERYGYDNAMKNKEIFKKAKNTYRERYGCFPYFIPTSKQQKLINGIVKGELNYFCNGYFLDIALLSDKIDIEYDGSGHDLSVKFGKMDYDTFIEKQKKRDDKLIENGWKIIRIVCKNDNLPENSIIQNELESCIKKLKETEINFMTIVWK